MTWDPSPAKGVWRKRLERIGGQEDGMVTSIVRFDPGCGFPLHRHPEGEEVLVLDGVFEDEYGVYPTGTVTLLPDGSFHAPFSSDGCTLLVKLRQYRGQDRPTCRIDTNAPDGWRTVGPGRERFDLYGKEGEDYAYLSRIAPGTRVDHHDHPGGEEVFVISGDLADENGHYRAGTWLRLAAGTSHQPYTQSGCLLYVRLGHLPAG